jgi:hypothetical protein
MRLLLAMSENAAARTEELPTENHWRNPWEIHPKSMEPFWWETHRWSRYFFWVY